jgi:hypothetical protein
MPALRALRLKQGSIEGVAQQCHVAVVRSGTAEQECYRVAPRCGRFADGPRVGYGDPSAAPEVSP